jgi:hypothetical protein
MDREYWHKWARTLQQSRMIGLVSALLEGAGPIRFLLSQVLFGCSPFIGQHQLDSWQAFARMMENPAACKEFATFLDKERAVEQP